MYKTRYLYRLANTIILLWFLLTYEDTAMATKPADTTNTSENTEALNPAVVELLNEFAITSRNLNAKKATVRVIKRSLATLKDIIADLETEISK
jgi:hypothetical protein